MLSTDAEPPQELSYTRSPAEGPAKIGQDWSQAAELPSESQDVLPTHRTGS